VALGPAQLEALAHALERGRLAPSTVARLRPLLGELATIAISDEVNTHFQEMGEKPFATVLRAVASERRVGASEADRRLELVWTGPEQEQAGTRDTSVVVRELFQQAEREVIVAGYAVFGGRTIFAPLAERALQRPALKVQLYLNIRRREYDLRPEIEIVREFGRYFLQYEWPGASPPEVYYDPRGLDPVPERCAVLHAKCVVVDDRRAFITSANLTEAAQLRNIEAGVLVHDSSFARRVRCQFEGLRADGSVRKIQW
jgi:phosphatidylserine/phosphatidylglycerophosphate/cardiolipin synthase-like enzyme